jgi:hypothetical protein
MARQLGGGWEQDPEGHLVLTFLFVSPASFFSLYGIKVPQGNGISEKQKQVIISRFLYSDGGMYYDLAPITKVPVVATVITRY